MTVPKVIRIQKIRNHRVQRIEAKKLCDSLDSWLNKELGKRTCIQ